MFVSCIAIIFDIISSILIYSVYLFIDLPILITVQAGIIACVCRLEGDGGHGQ